MSAQSARKKIILGRSLLIALAVVSSHTALANGGGSTSVVGLAFSYHVGPKDNSVAGATSFAGSLSSETSGGAFRLAIGFGLNYASGILTTANTQYDIQRIGTEVRLGFTLNPFSAANMQPVIGLYGLSGADLIRSPSPPASSSISEISLSVGYEVEAGMGFQLGASNLRLLGAYRKYTGRYAGATIAFDTISLRTAIAF